MVDEGLLFIGIIVVIGGIGAAGWASFEIDDMGIQRYSDVEMYDFYATVRTLGFISALVGSAVIVIAIFMDRLTASKERRVIQVECPFSSKRVNFCPSCGRRIEMDAAWCTGCGRNITQPMIEKEQ